jgi:hypothetical protein
VTVRGKQKFGKQSNGSPLAVPQTENAAEWRLTRVHCSIRIPSFTFILIAIVVRGVVDSLLVIIILLITLGVDTRVKGLVFAHIIPE